MHIAGSVKITQNQFKQPLPARPAALPAPTDDVAFPGVVLDPLDNPASFFDIETKRTRGEAGMIEPRDEQYNVFGRERISQRQIDELTGIARGLCADGAINTKEVEFLQTWLAANMGVSSQSLIATLYRRVDEILRDGIVDADECAELMIVLDSLSNVGMETGEALKATRLPLCDPAPALNFTERAYCFTGTFSYGRRHQCEAAVHERGGTFGSLTKKTNVLVVGIYATESWKHSAFGNKILKACDMRDKGVPIFIVSKEHWVKHL